MPVWPSAGQILQDQHKDQHMYGIKDIAGILEWLALLALLPIWLYRGRQGYHSKPFQYACYAFYPVHMLILVLILQYLTR